MKVLARVDIALAFHMERHGPAPLGSDHLTLSSLDFPTPQNCHKETSGWIPLKCNPQTATAYIQVPNQLQQSLYSQKLKRPLREAKHQVCAIVITSTCLSNSKPIPKDLVACDDSIVIINTYYHALLVSEA